MDILFSGIIIFLFMLAVFDLSVGVSNDAVNFLNSAVGSKAAPLKKIILIAAIGVFVGAVMSNGMMDIARHGIFHPEHFSFYEIICILMAVMITDIILLDIFNSLGMPTSTTVSMVFELLGATFAISIIKLASDSTGLGFADLLNTEKALSVILGIFISVAIAFFFGTIVQFISRLFFTFNYHSRLKWKIGLFGGVAATAIIYFLLIKGAKDMTFMTPEVKGWINDNTIHIIGGCLIFFTLLMQVLHWCKVNVFKVIVLMGTFSLAMAFAGNDLVNFIGVPLTGLDSYKDYIANGGGNAHGFMMDSLNSSAQTPVYFLIGAGIIMVIALFTSKKAQNVIKTEVGLGSQNGSEEMFGSSSIARRMVRSSLTIYSWFVRIIPTKARQWLGRRFNSDQAIIEDGAAFDLIRGSVNLTLAGMLIALGTSLKLPLSTTYVTFMVAMGSSLADRAWGRESAVFRITGVISVIGGWFITAGAAFIGAAIIVSLMHFGGSAVIIASGIIAIILLVRNNIKYRAKASEEKDDVLFQSILATEENSKAWDLLQIYIAKQQSRFTDYALEMYRSVTSGFTQDDAKRLTKTERSLLKEKAILKSIRRKETLCLRKIDKGTAIEKSAWFYLSNNCCMAMLYNLRRITEVCKEHVENNFHPLPEKYMANFSPICNDVCNILKNASDTIENHGPKTTAELRRECDRIKNILSDECSRLFDSLHEEPTENMSVLYVYLNLLQETQELISNLRKLIKASHKLKRRPQSERESRRRTLQPSAVTSQHN